MGQKIVDFSIDIISLPSLISLSRPLSLPAFLFLYIIYFVDLSEQHIWELWI